jgi:hypothetical protein
MGNMIESKKCFICKKNKATLYRNIGGREYFICDNPRCDFLTLLRSGLLKKRKLNLNIELKKEKRNG